MGRVREGRGSPREALHGKRLVLHRPTPRPRPPPTTRAPPTRGGSSRRRPARSGVPGLHRRAATSRKRRPSSRSSGSSRRRPSSTCAPRTPSARRAPSSRAGDHVNASLLRGEVAFKADRQAEAAALFVRGHDFLRAAELFESVGQLAEAAAAFEAGESWAAAGGVYARAGLKDRAAAAYEKGGEYETAAKLYEEAGQEAKAAELYERAGQTYKSGEAAARAGERDKAIALLQRVGPPTRTTARPPSSWRGSSSSRACRPWPSSACRRSIAGQPVAADHLDLYYWLALAHEASGQAKEALAIYEKIRAEDLSFRDVAKRADRLRSAGPAAPRRAAASGRPPAGRPAAARPLRRLPPRAAARSRSGAAAPAAPRGPRFALREEIGRGPWASFTAAKTRWTAASVALRVLPADPAGRRASSGRGGRAEGGLPALAPEPREGHRPHRDLRPALPRHRARLGQELRRGPEARPPHALPAGARPRAASSPRRCPSSTARVSCTARSSRRTSW